MSILTAGDDTDVHQLVGLTLGGAPLRGRGLDGQHPLLLPESRGANI